MDSKNLPLRTVALATLLVAIFAPLPTSQNQYCSISSQHTLCKYQGVGPRCKTPFELGIPPEDRELIMDMHNSYRSRVASGRESRGRPGPQPTASNMKELVWDDELAATAQRLADQCKYAHDCLECRKVSRFLTGQNLYQFSENIRRPKANWGSAINAWYDEVAQWSPSHIQSFHFIKPLGHYTQMMWAETERMGCGYSYFNDGKWNRKLYICNYGSAGNIVTTPMYLQGSPCSACPQGTSCSLKYPGLCTASHSSAIVFPQSQSAPFAGFQSPAPAPIQPRPTTTTTTTTTPRPSTKKPEIINEIESNDLGFETRSNFPRKNRNNQNRFFYETQGANGGRRAQDSPPQFSFVTTSGPSRPLAFPSPPTTSQPFRFSSRIGPNTPEPISANARFIPNAPEPISNQNERFTPQSRAEEFKPTTGSRFFPSRAESEFNPSTVGSGLFPSRAEDPFRPTTSLPQPFPSRAEQESAPPTAVSQVSHQAEPPVRRVTDVNKILIYCDFDFAKCPIRFTGSSWNYSETLIGGFGRGFGVQVPSGQMSNLFIRSVMSPEEDGQVCLSFRYLKPLTHGAPPLRVTAGTLNQKPRVVELSDESSSPADWLTASIQFENLRSNFLVIFQVPRNPLQEPIRVAIDDVLVTRGLCH